MTKNIIDTFIRIENAAHTGAFGNNPRATPTDAQAIAGNYKLGKTTIYGLPVAIEQPRNSCRTGIDQVTGKRWSNRLAAHYGYFSGTRGADGDGVDCFIGFYPQSELIYIINQFVNGRFDEHKVCLCFPDEQTATRAYLDSYDKGWTGLQSIIKASIAQFKWWLKNGNMNNAIALNHLPYEGLGTMNQQVTWDSTATPKGMSLEKLLYEIRRSDNGENLILDAVCMRDILEGAESIMALDALVTPYAKLKQKMDTLQKVMDRHGGAIKVAALQISDPFKQSGVAQVAVIFELSDGQTVTIFFHNPDVDPRKIQQGDELISWKWLLNKKDITIVVAPEKGQDLNIKAVAERIMRLAEKNSAAFVRANSKRAEKMQAIEDIKVEITGLEQELKDVQHELEVAKVEAEDKPVAEPVPIVDPVIEPEVIEPEPVIIPPEQIVTEETVVEPEATDLGGDELTPETTIEPELTPTEQEPNEQENQQAEVTAETEEGGTGAAVAVHTKEQLLEAIDELIANYFAEVMGLDDKDLEKSWISDFAGKMVSFDGDPKSKAKYEKLAKELITPNAAKEFPLMYANKIIMLNELSGIVASLTDGGTSAVNPSPLVPVPELPQGLTANEDDLNTEEERGEREDFYEQNSKAFDDFIALHTLSDDDDLYEFHLTALIVNQEVEAFGGTVAWGEFDASAYTGELFDSANYGDDFVYDSVVTPGGIVGQIADKNGMVVARVRIEENGIMTLLSGPNGTDKAADPTAVVSKIHSAVAAVFGGVENKLKEPNLGLEAGVGLAENVDPDLDPNIGRKWNSQYGRQQITERLIYGSGDLYEVKTIGKNEIRKYSVSDIEEIIKSNEHHTTPEYRKEVEDAKELDKLRVERDERLRIADENRDAEISGFTDHKGMKLINAEKARLALIKQVSVNGNFTTRKTWVEDVIGSGGYVIEHDDARRLITSTGSFFEEKDVTKTGMDYAEYLSAKKGVSDISDTNPIVDDESQNTGHEPATLSQAKAALIYLKKFIGIRQLNAISTEMRGEEKQFFFDKVVDLEKFIKKMPKTYDQDGLGDKSIAYLHYFKGNMDWHITERDMEVDQFQAFGMANLGHGGEMGYISIEELIKNNVEIDLYWTPKTIRVIKGGKDEPETENEPVPVSGDSDEIITPTGEESGEMDNQIEEQINETKAVEDLAPAVTGNTELDKQRAKLKSLAALQEQMKSANKVLKNSKSSGEQKQIALTGLGYSEAEVYKLMRPDFAGRVGFSYHLTNNNAVMKNTQKRIAQLEAQELAESMAANGDSETSYDFDGGTINLDYGDNRLRVNFDTKPDQGMISRLKQNGFKWSPINTAWQRQLTDNAISTANYLFGTKIQTAASAMNEEVNKPRGEVVVPAATEPQVNPIIAAFEIELNALKLETDIERFDSRLDEIVGRIELVGMMEEMDVQLNSAADVLTALMAEAEKIAA